MQKKETIDYKVVNKYVAEVEKARRVIDTKKFSIREAYNRAENTTRGDDHLINLESLSEQDSIDSFVKEFSKSMDSHVNGYYGKAEDIFKRDDLWREYAGFTEGTFYNLIDQLREKTSFENFMANFEDKFKVIEQNALQTPVSVLGKDDGEAVIAYLNNASISNAEVMKLIDVKQLVNPFDMAELINEYLAKDVVSVKFIKDKPYEKK